MKVEDVFSRADRSLKYSYQVVLQPGEWETIKQAFHELARECLPLVENIIQRQANLYPAEIELAMKLRAIVGEATSSKTRPDDCMCTSGALQPSDGCPHHGNL
jgi:hypothetical protein